MGETQGGGNRRIIIIWGEEEETLRKGQVRPTPSRRGPAWGARQAQPPSPPALSDIVPGKTGKKKSERGEETSKQGVSRQHRRARQMRGRR